MGKVDDIHDAEDDRQTQRHHCQHHTEQKAGNY